MSVDRSSVASTAFAGVRTSSRVSSFPVSLPASLPLGIALLLTTGSLPLPTHKPTTG